MTPGDAINGRLSFSKEENQVAIENSLLIVLGGSKFSNASRSQPQKHVVGGKSILAKSNEVCFSVLILD